MPAQKPLTKFADRPLTPRQARFVAYYAKTGSGIKAAQFAGYKGKKASLYAFASQLLRIPKVREAIDALCDSDPGIADRRERLVFWTSTMRDATAAMKDRIKASEILAKVFRDYDDAPVQAGRTEVDLTKLSADEFDAYCKLTRIAAGKPPLTNEQAKETTEVLSRLPAPTTTKGTPNEPQE